MPAEEEQEGEVAHSTVGRPGRDSRYHTVAVPKLFTNKLEESLNT